MAMCPACDHQVRTPSFFNLDGWRHFRCPYCKARLEMKPPRSYLLGPVIAPLFVLARQGRIFEIMAFVYMFATIVLVLVESSRPKLRLRKRPLAKPAVWLKIGRPSH
jgi:hypothetical protein